VTVCIVCSVEHQGVKLDPDNVETTAASIAAYLQSIGVMTLQPHLVGTTSVGSRIPCYSCFISYRVDTDKAVAELLYEKLCRRGYNSFLDKFCLLPGQPWECGFRLGLARSRVLIPRGLDSIKRCDAESLHRQCFT
jgi:hypothetical protein